MNIIIITYKDQDIEFTVGKKQIDWSMEVKGNRYGNAIVLPSKKMTDIIGVVASCVSNAILTYEELTKTNKQENEN